MSSPLAVSAFYEVDILQNQNRRNLAQHKAMTNQGGIEQKAVGTPITGAIRNRNILERSMSEPADRNANNQHPQLSMASSQQQQQSQSRQNVNSSRYKTELCRPFEENGYCKYGDKCQFAHGQHELRSLARHPKYKTELCRTFHTIGFCPYGPRCHFIHNEDERKLSQIDQMKQHNPEPQMQQQQQGPPPMGRVTPPQQAPRPSRFQLSLPLVRDSLGSTADSSPPSSVTDSPTMSPTFVGENDILGSSLSSLSQAFSGRNPPVSAPPTTHQLRSAFQFPQDLTTTLMTPLNIHTDPIASLSAGLQTAVTLSSRQHHNQRNNDNNNLNFLNSFHEQQQYLISALKNNISPLSDTQEFYAPPSPPDSLSGDSISSTGSASSSSLCGSPLEASRGFRLPIFTSLSMD